MATGEPIMRGRSSDNEPLHGLGLTVEQTAWLLAHLCWGFPGESEADRSMREALRAKLLKLVEGFDGGRSSGGADVVARPEDAEAPPER